MGLALLDPSDTTYLHGLGEPRDLPGRREHLRARHRRRPAEWTRNKFPEGDLCYELGCHAQECLSRRGGRDESDDDDQTSTSEASQIDPAGRPTHRRRWNKHHEATQLDARLKFRSSPRLRRRQDEDEGRALARSRILLPGDQGRTRRPPSLERQEAFRDASTSRKRTASGLSDLDDEAELYRMGLLYDDEHERGSGFHFGLLASDAPEIRLRPAKRGRKRKHIHRQAAPDLSLHLSFSALGDDKALAPFLFPIPSVEDPVQEKGPAAVNFPEWAERKYASQPALTTIYELERDDVAPFLSEPNTQFATSHVNISLEYDLDLTEQEDDPWAFLGAQEENGTVSPSEDDAWIVLDDDL